MTSLSIRNLTIHPLELISIERFEAECVQTGTWIGTIAASVTGFLNATYRPSHLIIPRGDALRREDVSIRIEPFRTIQTGVPSATPGREIIRLAFRHRSHRYETDVPSPKSKAAHMSQLVHGPGELTAVYVANDALLAVFSRAKLHAWMKEIHHGWPLPMLSIPGTHNSPTCYVALPSVRCQAASIKEQLNNGIRFLDIRVSVDLDSDALALVHSAFPISLTGKKYFMAMLEDIYSFLDDNPSETVIMSVKREGTGKGSDADLSKYLKHIYVDGKRDRWYTKPEVPTLGQCRGLIVLVRRFDLDDELRALWDGRGWGIDAHQWPDNCQDGLCSSGHFRIQDFYKVNIRNTIHRKIEYSRGLLERAAEQVCSPADKADLDAQTAPRPFFINFLTGSNFFNASCWPERIAAKVNPALVEYLCVKHGVEVQGPAKAKIGSVSTGIVVTDWVGAHGDWDLIRCVVGMNARLQMDG